MQAEACTLWGCTLLQVAEVLNVDVGDSGHSCGVVGDGDVAGEHGRDERFVCTGLGKALLSTKSEEEIDEYIATVPRTAYTLHTLTDGARLKQDLLAAKEKGYAEDISEISDSLHCTVHSPSCSIRGRV